MKKIQITLKGNPVSTNTIYRYACRGNFPTMYMTKKGKDTKEDYQWQIKSQYHGKPLLRGLKLHVTLFFGNKRVHDIDNYNKVLYDAFSGLVWEDDQQVIEVTTLKKYDKSNPRIEVEIEELPEDF